MLISSVLGAPPGRRRRRARARPVEGAAGPEPLPLSRLTVVTPDRLDPEEAARWLERLSADPGAADAFVDHAVVLINRALHAHATAARDPYLHEVSAGRAVGTRIGYGEGEQVADGRWSDARELERGEPRRRRAAHIEPQERVAAVLGGRVQVPASETLLLRARLDLDQGRTREAALQLRAAIAALLAEPEERAGDAQRDDLAKLRAGEPDLEAVAAAALRSDIEPDRRARLDENLAICERVVRRRALGYL